MAFPDSYDTSLMALSGLQAYWPLDDPAGGTLNSGNHFFHEASGNWAGDTHLWYPYVNGLGDTGATSILPAVSSTCLHKTATSADYSIPWSGLSGAEQTAISQAGPLSFCCWVQLDQLIADTNGNIFIWGTFGGYNLLLAREAVQFGMHGVGTTGTQRVIVPNNPMFLTHTYDRAQSIVYVNGVALATSNFTAAVGYTSNNIELGGILGSISATFVGYIQKAAFFSTALTPTMIQNLYIAGATTTAEVAGRNLNVYPFSRQAIGANGARNTITLQNASDTFMYASLGTSPAVAKQGVVIPPNGGSWSSSSWKGAIQLIHSSPLGAKTLLIQET